MRGVRATVAAMATTVVVGGTAAAQAPPIKIGASLSVTGTYAKLGAYQREGYALCEKHINAANGLLGRPVSFVVYDDQSTPATAIRLYEKLLSEDKVDAVMGPYSSPITEAVKAVTEKYQKVMVAPMAATTSIWYPRDPRVTPPKYLFMIQPRAESYLEGFIDVAARMGVKTLALVNEDTLLAKAVATGAAGLAKDRGLTVVLQEAYPKGTTDFSAMLLRVKAANPDALAAATYFDDAVAITRQLKELDVNPKMFGLTIGGDLPEFVQLLGKQADFVYGATQWEATLPYPGVKEFVEAYRKEFKREPVYHAAAGYSGCQVFAEGVRRAGSLDAERLRQALLALRLRTPFGDYQVNERGFQVGRKMLLMQWQDGKKALVWPDDVGDGKARFPTPAWNQRP
jgi:branched-chain amino acid transport system substrate-binding protein